MATSTYTPTSTVSRLNKTLASARKTRLYASKLPDRNLTSIRDFQEQIPFTTKQDLRDAYPYGGLALPLSEVLEIHTSSGTSGKPVGSFQTRKDLDLGSKEIGKAWSTFGVDKNSIVMFAMSYGLFSGAMLNTYAVQSLGAFVVPASIVPVDKYIDLIQDYGVDTLVGVPGFYYYLHAAMLRRGIDPKKTSLKRAIAAGETYSDETREAIERLFDITVYDHYGLAEINTGIAYECAYRNGMHILDDYVYAEVIGADGKPVAKGEKGELVLTTLGKEASPVFRYKTNDVVYDLGSDVCECGRKTKKISRLQGRADSVVSIKGVKVDPYALRNDLRNQFPDHIRDGLMALRIMRNRIDYTPTLVVTLDDAQKRTELVAFLKNHTMITFDIEHVPVDYWFANKNKAAIVEYVD